MNLIDLYECLKGNTVEISYEKKNGDSMEEKKEFKNLTEFYKILRSYGIINSKEIKIIKETWGYDVSQKDVTITLKSLILHPIYGIYTDCLYPIKLDVERDKENEEVILISISDVKTTLTYKHNVKEKVKLFKALSEIVTKLESNSIIYAIEINIPLLS